MNRKKFLGCRGCPSCCSLGNDTGLPLYQCAGTLRNDNSYLLLVELVCEENLCWLWKCGEANERHQLVLCWQLSALLVLITQHVSQIKLLLELGLLGVTALDHRITKWYGLVKDHLVPTPHTMGREHLPLDQVAQIPIQPGEHNKNIKNTSNPLHISSLSLLFINQPRNAQVCQVCSICVCTANLKSAVLS